MEELKFTTPTEVQDKLIPIVLAGRDLVGESKTGSGKLIPSCFQFYQQLDEESDSVQGSYHSSKS
ncbi:ATP-dependent RNA helicase [Streptococcus infantis SK1302]|uniref:ATP-dependent RNA helicase n=1 Tax=Streptococcus infantis SK1302 TaxID=871237 RepID=A0ABN0B798_9STRE|nr:ATP-dependent RNA helicase [Streptococcus infantis SK1302]